MGFAAPSRPPPAGWSTLVDAVIQIRWVSSWVHIGDIIIGSGFFSQLRTPTSDQIAIIRRKCSHGLRRFLLSHGFKVNRTRNSTRLASLYKLAILSVGARWDLRKEPTGRIVKNENEKHISDW